MKIFLDDERKTPEGFVRCYWPDEVIKLLETEKVSLVSLDHDLGDDSRGTGYDVVLWIEQQVVLHRYTPPEIWVHSANTSAVEKMRSGIDHIEWVHKRNTARKGIIEKEVKTLFRNAITKWRRGDFENNLHRYHRKGVTTSRYIDAKTGERICKVKTERVELTLTMQSKSPFGRHTHSTASLHAQWLTLPNSEVDVAILNLPSYAIASRFRAWVTETLTELYRDHDII